MVRSGRGRMGTRNNNRIGGCQANKAPLLFSYKLSADLVEVAMKFDSYILVLTVLPRLTVFPTTCQCETIEYLRLLFPIAQYHNNKAQWVL
ncbi:hypothetical protein PHET_02074 [Paragonimus heterotremus]|uniref:Uncharacterized protein n=1 Tax=Paragonimus heterotremus TaxID=100268 RepID=A0A8J4SST0_9TREM|nr:hypothetical protein PHET_02074 [Paragonimus heterotremus]